LGLFGSFWGMDLEKKNPPHLGGHGKVIRDWVRFGADWFVKPRMVRPVGEANLPFEFRVQSAEL
jgi:hypothetical protein